MSDKGFEQGNKNMSVDYVTEARSMAEVIVQKVHRGPGDTIDAAIVPRRAEIRRSLVMAASPPLSRNQRHACVGIWRNRAGIPCRNNGG